MAIKDMQTLYEEGYIADPLDGSELMLIEQGGVSKVLRMDTAAAYFQQYFEQNSACCTATSTPSFLRLSAISNESGAYGADQINITANGELLQIPCSPSESWRDALIAYGNLNYSNQVELGITTYLADGSEFLLLVISNLTAGAGTDNIEIELLGGSTAVLAEQDGNPTYALVDANPAHATFQLSRV
jgi:hypothetical protein